MDSKIQMLWKVGKEQEELFRKEIKNLSIFEEIDMDELFKLIRGTEYRRGKEDGVKQSKDEQNGN